MTPRARGLPVAAYLGALVALALAAAFVATLAVVIWLPPRPPDVMREDLVAGHFQVGYDRTVTTGRPPPETGLVWNIRNAPPRTEDSPPMAALQHRLAAALHLSGGQVRVAARHVAQHDVFVFRVRDVEGEAPPEHAPGEASPPESTVSRRVVVVRDGGADVTIEHASDEASEAEAAIPARLPHVAPPAPPPPPPPLPPLFAPAPEGVMLISGFEIGAQLPDGRWLTMRQGRNWAEISWIARAALIIAAALASLSLLAIAFARRLTRPIRNFSEAVQAVGVNPQSEPVTEEGPQELRGAARAVNAMQTRLRALIADRTKTLAAVAHDMRTPLMRLRLAAENAPPEQRERMAKEIGEVEALVASFIAFARDDPAEEARVRIDLTALLQSIADDHTQAGRGVEFDAGERIIVTGQSLGLKRLFSNLIENALKYGAAARITMSRSEGMILVDIDDDGPGVPAEQRETVFEPFVRLSEGGRGAGLGLPAARSIARAHGGDVVMLDRAQGGRVRVTLPA
ncbi:MAG: ATP-binding protein [Hyphomonadaceae bacterium]